MDKKREINSSTIIVLYFNTPLTLGTLSRWSINKEIMSLFVTLSQNRLINILEHFTKTLQNTQFFQVHIEHS